MGLFRAARRLSPWRPASCLPLRRAELGTHLVGGAVTGIDRERMLREAYPDEQERLDVRLGRANREAKELGESLARAQSARRETRTEADRRATHDVLKVRLPLGYRARLQRLADEDGYSVAEWVQTWIEMAETEIAGLRARPARRVKR